MTELSDSRRNIDATLHREIADMRADVEQIKTVTDQIPPALQTLAAVQERLLNQIDRSRDLEKLEQRNSDRIGQIERDLSRNCTVCDRLWTMIQAGAVLLVGALLGSLGWLLTKHLERLGG